jgi:hypothetical protein
VNGGTRTAVWAKLIFRARAKGIRKNISRKTSGGRMRSQRLGRINLMRLVAKMLQSDLARYTGRSAKAP